MAPALIALAQFAPSILRFMGVGDSKSPPNIIDKISDVAKSITGVGSIDEAITVFASSSEKAYEFKIQMLAHDRQFEQMYLADMQSARLRDTEFIKAGTVNSRGNWMSVGAVLVTLGMVFIIWRDPDINEYMKGIFTLVLGRFLGYLDTIYSFEFGTTRSSKGKDESIAALAKSKERD